MKFFKYTAAAAAILAMAGGVLAADRTLETDVVIVGAGAGRHDGRGGIARRGLQDGRS